MFFFYETRTGGLDIYLTTKVSYFFCLAVLNSNCTNASGTKFSKHNKKVPIEDSYVGPKSRKKKKQTKHSPCSHLGYTRQNLVRAENDQQRPARDRGPCPATPNHLMLSTGVATTRSAKTNNDVQIGPYFWYSPERVPPAQRKLRAMTGP